jgi:hypothetical protein
MQSFPINYLALLVAAVAKSVLGSIWYPLLGKQWRDLAGVTLEQVKEGMGKAMVVDLVGNYVMAFVLVHAVHYAGAKGIGEGAAIGFFNWLGFIAMVTLGSVFFERRPMKLWFINNVYLAVSLMVMGAIVAVWT